MKDKNIKFFNNNNNNNIFNKNIATFIDYNNLTLNFKNFIKTSESIIFKNCSNLNIIINSDINRIELYNCTNINIKIKKLIGGIIVKFTDLFIEFAKHIYNLEIENSIIKLQQKIYKDISMVQKFKSKIIIQ